MRTRRFDDFPEPYEDQWVEIQVNVPMTVVHKMEEGGYDNIYEALERFVMGWNLTNEEGETLPITREGMEGLPVDLFILLQRRVWEVLRNPLAEMKLPES